MKVKIFSLILFFSMTLASCGGGGSTATGNNNHDYSTPGADFVTITVDSGTPYTYTETADITSPVSYDPYIWSSVSGTTSTHVYIHTYNGSSSSTPRMEIIVNGTTPGTYNINDGNRVDYMPIAGTNYFTGISFPERTGAIIITEFGASGGGQIKGSFDLIAKVGTTPSNAHLVGSFTVTRY